MRHTFRTVICFAAVLLGAVAFSAALGADFKSDRGGWLLSGQINDGDTDKLKALTHEVVEYNQLLLLDSPGGSYAEAIKLARYVRSKNMATVIRKNASCKSACGIVFLAGGNDYDGARRLLEVGGILGFHSPYIDNQQAVANADVFSRSVIETMKAITRLLNEFGIETALIPALMPNRADRGYKFIDDVEWVGKLEITLVQEQAGGAMGERFPKREFRKPDKFTKAMAVNLCRSVAEPVGYDNPFETGQFIELPGRIFFPGAGLRKDVAFAEGYATWCLIFTSGACYATELSYYDVLSWEHFSALAAIRSDQHPEQHSQLKWSDCKDQPGSEFFVPSETKLSDIDRVILRYEREDTVLGRIWEGRPQGELKWTIKNASDQTAQVKFFSYSRVRGYTAKGKLDFPMPKGTWMTALPCKETEVVCSRSSIAMSCESGAAIADKVCCHRCSRAVTSTIGVR